ncbi:enoyl-CoA hydratase/isomerase family protein [Singulisphaera sp. PoT]|uniref:enoyl-CoA hydratase/isomerase family protein n=1 Tax=Singulisphaera sp. PoT TaxID=3411797 RepID=UPI003BF49981
MSGRWIRREDRGPVAIVTLNRPERRNALSQGLMGELSDELSRVGSDLAIRSVVLTGDGPAFCSGMDLKDAVATLDASEDERKAIADVQAIADLIAQVHQLPKPTIAALNGDAFAGGAGLAVACDFVLMAEGARLGYPEVRRGLVAAIVMHDLIRQIGERRARSLLIGGNPIAAEVAESWGLINQVVPEEELLARAIALGKSLVASAPIAVESTKRLIDEASGRPKDLRGAAAITAAVRVSSEAEEGMRAFLERRPPDWETGTSMNE